ncbi:Cytochrome C assembly protein [Rubrivivax sp. A210]|uniref:cytochrome C assembly family protein n=1 Tax=Rubrivivax sp. A210 TaxID=2772301 RepID=UPI0019181DE6|nr:cytochrome c biogenesis protein CcsA [Rubrivivax sp. A210]CAD5374168.1 Cytochrome C assembly protein [Rubrivivax sp. A210]
MILSTASATLVPGGAWLLVTVAAALYILTALPIAWLRQMSAAALLGGLVLHGLLLIIDIGGFGQPMPGARLGFGPVLSMTLWLVIAVYTVESRLVPLPAVRKGLGAAGVLAVLMAALFPGELRQPGSALAPLHFALGVGSYGLFGAAVLHAALLDAAERRLRRGAGAATAGRTLGMPLLQLERLTFRFVGVGFVALTATLVLGILYTVQWHWGNHKAVFSILAWCVFAALLLGRRLRGWRGRRATRGLYAGALLLLLAYAGSRFVYEVLLGRTPA